MLSELPVDEYKWRKPGAFHHARWLSHLLYAPKMLAFSEQMQYSKDYITKLETFVLYSTLFYLPWCIRSAFAAEAPSNDLICIKTNLHIPHVVESRGLADVATAVQSKLQRHT